MSSERPPQLRPVAGGDPIWRLWQDLPAEWRGPVIGAGIENWEAVTENGERRLDLAGLPDPIPAELAWMAHWQATDGTRCSIWALNQLANILRRARREHHSFPPSIRAMDWASAAALQGWFYATRWGRLPPPSSRARLRVVFRFARLALLARCHDGPWWALNDWHPRCDPRIPLSAREPLANYGCSPGQITQPWLRQAVKWHLGTQLEAGRCAGRRSARNGSSAWAASTTGSPTTSTSPAPSSAIPHRPPNRPPRSGAGPRTRPTG